MAFERTETKYIWYCADNEAYVFEDETGTFSHAYKSKEDAKSDLDGYVKELG